MTVAVAPSPYRRGAGSFLRGGLRALLVLVGPAVVAVLALRYAFPSRLAGAAGGVEGFLAWVADRHPLFVSLALFVTLSEVGRYWTQRMLPAGAPADAALFGGDVDARAAWRKRTARLLGGLAAAAVLAFVVRSSVVATYTVVGPSMLPTLEVGDRVMVNRRAYGTIVPLSKTHLGTKLPARGDLVVFPASGLVGSDGTQEVVKRVVGLPGDTVAYQQGQLVINDWLVPACDAGPYVDLLGRLTVRGRLVMEYLGDKTYLTVRNVMEAPFAGYTVKPGEVFVVGDDRGISSDSRLWHEGRGAGVPVDLLDGKVTRVLFGARPDGRLDFSRLLAPPLELKVRLRGIDLAATEKRIDSCVKRRPAITSPPAPLPSAKAFPR